MFIYMLIFVALFKYLASHDPETLRNDVVSIVFAGDISLGPPIRKANRAACPYQDILKHVSTYLHDADYNMVNLESPFVPRNVTKKDEMAGKGVHIKAWPESIAALTSAGVRAVTLANNHINDFNNISVRVTQYILKQHSIDWVGLTEGCRDPYEPQIPIIKTINGVTFGILAYCGDTANECLKYREGQSIGVAILEKETVEHDIDKLKKYSDVIIVYLHWGKEYFSLPTDNQRRVGEFLSNLGVKLIVGSHPHVLQGHEWINNTLIHYSLGNFVFHPHFTYIGRVRDLEHDAKVLSHKLALLQHKFGRGPPSMTELLKVVIDKNGIVDAYYLPARIHADLENGCVYPVPLKDEWKLICGEEDNNCYQPKRGYPVYP